MIALCMTPSGFVPVLLLDQFNAESLVENPHLLDLASFQDQERQRNVGHESTSTVGPLSSYAVLPQFERVVRS